MKSFITFILLLSFIGISLFGLMMMGHGKDMAHNHCIAAVTQNFDCLEAIPMANVMFHFDTWRTWTAAYLNESGMLSGLLLIIVAVIAGAVLLRHILSRTISPAFIGYTSRTLLPASSSGAQLLRWLSVHVNSPNSFA